MSIASKYNHGARFDYQIPKDATFVSLGKLFERDGKGTVYTLHGLYVNHKSKYGDAPVAICENELVNLPKHLLDTVKQMLLDDEFITAVNNELIGFTIYAYTVKNDSALRYSVSWCDI